MGEQKMDRWIVLMTFLGMLNSSACAPIPHQDQKDWNQRNLWSSNLWEEPPSQEKRDKAQRDDEPAVRSEKPEAPQSRERSSLLQKDQKSFSSSNETLPPPPQQESHDIRVGMSMAKVRQIWGSPRKVKIAGDPSLGHQKWIYLEGYSSLAQGVPARIIYFEGGRVVGWETRSPKSSFLR